MNGISHKQAIKLIHHRLDGQLNQKQLSLLDEHLNSCESCRAYTAKMELLPNRLQTEFHARWDEKSGPSQKITEHIITKARRIPAMNRISSGFKLFAGAAALIVLVIAMNYVFLNTRNRTSSTVIEMPVIQDHPAPLMIDPNSCKPFSDESFDLRPPNKLYGYELIQGTSFVDGDFSYEFWLYCDPSLKPNDKENLNTIAGLGIFASWHYTGPKLEGPVQYYFEFEPNVPLGGTGWNGPLYRASASGARFGIDIPKTTVQAYVQQRTPVQFRVVVNSGLNQNSATLSFNLEPTGQGLRVVDLRREAEHLNPTGGNLIAFVSEQGGNKDIYVMKSDGSGVINLTNNPAEDVNPAWSPDGTQIAFVSDRTGFMQIFLMNADGTDVVQLTDDESDHEFGSDYGSGYSPWSPDGSRLIFSQISGGQEKSMLYTIDVNTEDKLPLVNEPNLYHASSWSLDGQHIAFIANDSQNPNVLRLYIVNADGSSHRDITKSLQANERLDNFSYAWSTDGQSLFFIAYKHISEGNDRWIAYEASVNDNALVERAISSTPMDSWHNGTSFIRGFDASHLTWLRSDGTSSTLNPLENCQMANDSYYGFIAKRSFNGDLLIGVDCPNEDLWFYWAKSDGTLIKQLFDSPILMRDGGLNDLVWSPDSKYIAINVYSVGVTYIYVVNVEASLRDPSALPEPIGRGTTGYSISWQPIP